MIFVNSEDIGFTGTELQDDINSNPETLARFERLRAIGAVQMGLIKDVKEAEARQHTPKIAFVAPPQPYVSSSGKHIDANAIDVNVRALSMGKLHHAMMGTAPPSPLQQHLPSPAPWLISQLAAANAQR